MILFSIHVNFQAEYTLTTFLRGTIDENNLLKIGTKSKELWSTLLRGNNQLYMYLSLLIIVRFIGGNRPKPRPRPTRKPRPSGGAGGVVKPGKNSFCYSKQQISVNAGKGASDITITTSDYSITRTSICIRIRKRMYKKASIS